MCHSGRYELYPDPTDGSIFIDRDGSHFHHVLNYLRHDGTFECPTDPAVLAALRDDAQFYGLPDLSALVDTAMHRQAPLR